MAKAPKPARRQPAVAANPPEFPFALPRAAPAEKRRALALLKELEKHYPTAHCELSYAAPHELLVATILSAQSTDVGVNKATPALFRRFPKPSDYAGATTAEIEPLIRTTGFFRNKAKAVHRSMTDVVHRFGGEVPRTMEGLLSLHGVARKTANVVLGNAYGINAGFVVDTHIERLSRRFGLVDPGASVTMIERRLMALFPRDRWCDLSHMIIWHGRRACKARGASCADHPICRRFGVACENRGKPGRK